MPGKVGGLPGQTVLPVSIETAAFLMLNMQFRASMWACMPKTHEWLYAVMTFLGMMACLADENCVVWKEAFIKLTRAMLVKLTFGVKAREAGIANRLEALPCLHSPPLVCQKRSGPCQGHP